MKFWKWNPSKNATERYKKKDTRNSLAGIGDGELGSRSIVSKLEEV